MKSKDFTWMLLQVHAKKWSKELYFVGVGRLYYNPLLFNRQFTSVIFHIYHLLELWNKVGEAMSSLSSLNCKNSISLKFLGEAIYDPNTSRQKIGMHLKGELPARKSQYFRRVVYKNTCPSLLLTIWVQRTEKSDHLQLHDKWLWYPKPEH